MIRTFLFVIPLFFSAGAIALELKGKFTQGALIIGTAEPESLVTLNGNPLPILPNGKFVFGLSRDSGPTVLLVARNNNGQIKKQTLKIRKRVYKEQKIFGLPQRKVTPKKQDYKRIAHERGLINAARRLMTFDADFDDGFVWPVYGIISSVYGSRRILNGEPRAPHLGVDIAAPSGTPVVAAADGVVSLTHENMFFTGKTIQLNHGLGVGTIYIHLSKVMVRKGQKVQKGQVIGRVGKTGRATGSHLHWGLTWRTLRLDPSLLVGPMPTPKSK